MSVRVSSQGPDPDELETSVSWPLVIMLLVGAVIGVAAMALLPLWLPGVRDSLISDRPTAYWMLSRASAMVAYTLLWISMASGVMITSKLARTWPGGRTAFAVHEHTSLLGLAFAVFHVLILLADRYIGYTLIQLLVPFATDAYRPVWVALGQVGMYALIVVTLS